MNEREQDLAVAERFYELWADGGIGALRPIMHDQVEWHPHPQAPEPGPFRGPDEVIRVALSYTQGFGRYRPVPNRIDAGADPGVVLGLATYTTVGREGGQEFTMAVGHLLEVRDGLVVRFEEIPDLVEALIAAGIEFDEEPTRVGGIALTMITAINEDDDGLVAAMIARGGEVDATCPVEEWTRFRVEDPEVTTQRFEALVVATLVPEDGDGRRVAVRLKSDPMGLIKRLTVSADVDAAREAFGPG
jgi:ketosteroid isomerase-like protein